MSSGLSTARIPFNVRMAEGSFKGEAIGIGDSLRDDCIFEVRLANGSSFLLKAQHDYELRRYTWTTQATDCLQKLIPFIGRIIEKYFASTGRA